MLDSFFPQLLAGAFMTLKLAICAFILGLPIGIFGAFLESIPNKILKYFMASLIFIIRGLPELLVLFFIYFGLTTLLSHLFRHYIDINAFVAGVIALGLIFGAYASQVFNMAFTAIDPGQIEAAKAVSFSRLQILIYVKLPQAWRHAIPGLGNLWLVLLKDTAIVSLIGLQDMMGEAKLAASSTGKPFMFYLIVALTYLTITTISQMVINQLALRQNRYLSTC